MEPPDDDELEISIFGRGFGEAIVCHLGDGVWMAIDSFLDEDIPMASTYLEALGVGTKAIRSVVLTHWDDDHTRGAADLVSICEPDDIWFSSVLHRKEWFRFATAQTKRRAGIATSSGTDEFVETLQIARSEVNWATEGQQLDPLTRASVHALAPTHQSVTDGMLAIAPVPAPPAERPTVRGLTPNGTSVAVWIRFGSHDAILGADLERGRKGRGWRGVLESRTVSRLIVEGRRATLLKMSHHGSENAQLPEMYRRLLVGAPYAMATRFNGGRKPRPSPEDERWISGRAKEAWVAGRPGQKQFGNNQALMLAHQTLKGGHLPSLGQVGHLCMRVRLSDPRGAWRLTRQGWTTPMR